MNDLNVLLKGETVAVSVEEAAKYLGISRNLAYDSVRRGEIPSRRYGRRLVVPVGWLLGEGMFEVPAKSS